MHCNELESGNMFSSSSTHSLCNQAIHLMALFQVFGSKKLKQ